MNKLDLSDARERVFGKMLKRQAVDNGDTLFLMNDDMRISFAEAEHVTNCLAGGLRHLGIESGDRIVLFMGNRPETVLLALAINKLGAIWTPINTDYKGQWLIDALTSTRSKLLITDEDMQPHLVDVQSEVSIPDYVLLGEQGNHQLGSKTHYYADLLASEPFISDYNDQDYGDTCAILWTSGTTGKSKGVMQSYNCWLRAIVGGASEQYKSQPGDVIYSILPLFNSAAWITNIFRALYEGIPCVIEKHFSVSRFWQRVEQFQVTQCFAIGAMGVFLLNAPEAEGDADNTLRVMNIVPMPPNLWEQFEQRFGVRLLRGGMGMSECLRIMSQVDGHEGVPVYALGFPPDDLEVALCDDDGNVVAPGEVGEICVKPKQPKLLFNGYFENPEATAKAFRGDWFLTGDMGRMDVDTGAYFYVDRKKDVVRFAGRNISTLEVESIVRRHDAVQDVAAFGIASPDIESEDELMLKVVRAPDQTVTAEDLCAYINANAPYYFVPRYLEFVDSLPYTPTNKVQKYLLREAGVSENTWDLKTSEYKVIR